MIGCHLILDNCSVCYVSYTNNEWTLHLKNNSVLIDFQSLLLFLNRVTLYLLDKDDSPLVTVQEFLDYHSFNS